MNSPPSRQALGNAFLLCFLYLFYFASSSFAAPGRVECNSLPSKILSRSVPYCVVLPPSFDADKARQFSILYFLHSLGDNEQFFVHSGAWNLAEELREKGELDEFLIATRLDRAKILLKMTGKSVKEVAFNTGFRSEVSFVTTFKRKTGFTPTEFRQR